ncbi:hypothetical protein BGZ65_009807 [Modicella reniformis]|uniref:Uncharacterized protein n=1 Tax=Modicella reniformis TaxID=1440133 RepID=A0A9P6JFZ0_9FUNG|nr:hypothetical protein BGZ65_009807 [Modicella reniformis]
MKVSAYSMTAGAVALSATVFALPEWYKRAADGTKVIRCLSNAIAIAQWPTGLHSCNPTVLSISSSGLNWPVKEGAQHVNIVYNGNVVGTFDTPSSPATFKDGAVSTIVQKCSMNIQPSFFVPLMASLINLSEVALSFRGSVDATFSTGGAPLIPKTYKITGSQDSLTVDPATGAYIITAHINVPNPSQLIMTLGDLTFQLFDTTDLVVGTVLLKKVQMNMGNNKFEATIRITNKSTYDALLIGPVAFTMKGFGGTSTNPVVVEGFKLVNTPFTIPKLTPAA